MIKQWVGDIVQLLSVNSQSFNYSFGENFWNNLHADEATFPIVYLEERIENDFLVENSGVIQEVYPLKLLFLFKTEMDFTPEQHDVQIQKARDGARQFINYIGNDTNVQSLKSVKGYEIKNVFDANASGVILTFTVQFYNSSSNCLPSPNPRDYVTITNSNETFTRNIPNSTDYIIPNTEFTVVDQNGNVLGDFIVPSVIGGMIEVETPPCEDATVTVNGNEFATVASGGTLDVPIVNGGSNPVGTIEDETVVIGNSSVFANGVQIGDVVAEDTLNVAVELDGTPAGSWNAETQTWEVDSVPTPIDVNINGITVANDASTDVELTLVDQDGNDVAFTQTGNDLEVTISAMFTHIINVDGVEKSNLTLDSSEDNTINVNLYS